jgi:predicted metal-dependent hydrolase
VNDSTTCGPAAPIEIIRRRVRLHYDAMKSRRWARIPREAEDALNAISFVFPVGEAFFARSVARYRHRITDPLLQDQAERFIYQEVWHSKEHDRANAALRESNALGTELEAASRILAGAGRYLTPPSTQLALTCAMEHFTAMLGERLLACRWLDRDGTDPEFRALWMWHAAEEIEHKAVCFDVYQHVFGRGFFAWLHLCFAMLLLTVTYGIGITIAFTMVRLRAWLRRLRRKAGATAPEGKAGPSLRVLFTGVAASRYFDYFRRSFHPWDHDDRALLEAWKRENPGFGMAAPAPASVSAAA